ncbi:DUF4139 domain-containing protein [Pseudorhodobacter ferrugineus]|uniref:DUF4139 domain-containing protein n=1 Tax=Pseudorhodobacter ferrugineus TaxID=77008 RepID=UPI0003B3AC9D|nr:DUF4139 domain-containing protein [Pseudorhodobacter ferrugineus]
MRRVILLSSLLLATPLQAETILASSKITAVTVYPQGAMLTRVVAFEAQPGLHDVLITDLPQDTDPQSLRLKPSEGVEIGAYSLRTGRLPVVDPVKPEAQVAAEAALEAAKGGVTTAQLAVDGVAARIEAAQAQIAYLGRLGATDAKADTETLQATARMIGAEVLAASQAALAARADLPAVQKVYEAAVEAQVKAQAALDALSKPTKDYAALSLAVSVTQVGPSLVEVTQFMDNATWAPIYDMALDRAAGQVVLDRSLLVSQATGEDWTGIALTLSTAQPGNSPDPSRIWPQLHRIDDPMEMAKLESRAAAPAPINEAEMGAMMETLADVAVGVAFQGDIVSYAYPQPVDIVDGAQNLRLVLDRVSLPASAQARAVPRADATAFMMAEFTNDSGQILLPGPATLTRDGALMGQTQLASIAPGATAVMGFGAIEGLRLKRIVPARAEGDRGIFSKSNQIEETAVLSVENLTDQAWDVRVMEGIPYSEQEDLVITYTADLPVTETDVDGQRGVLAWDVSVPAGKTQTITLTTRESWPDGKELNGGRY